MPRTSQLREAGRWVLLGFSLLLTGLVFLPWQQNVEGEGKVIAIDPDERGQNIEATVPGRVVAWHVREGQRVAAGELLVELSDNDANRTQRLEIELETTVERLRLAELREQTSRERMQAVSSAAEAHIDSARTELSMAQQGVISRQLALDVARNSETVALQQHDRTARLAADGLASSRDAELAQSAWIAAQGATRSAEAQLEVARSNVEQKRAHLLRAEAGALADRQAAQVVVHSSESDVQAARSAVAATETRVAQQSAQEVRAPTDGVVDRILVQAGATQVSIGEVLALFVPLSSAPAAEIFVDGNDASIILPGSEVRLQFEGWPAIQFSGWPSVATGTFGGRVLFVAPRGDVDGDFRVLVEPEAGAHWPDGRYLRQGTKVKAWVLLEEVRLGYEVWRQLNGFPPRRSEAPTL